MLGYPESKVTTMLGTPIRKAHFRKIGNPSFQSINSKLTNLAGENPLAPLHTHKSKSIQFLVFPSPSTDLSVGVQTTVRASIVFVFQVFITGIAYANARTLDVSVTYEGVSSQPAGTYRLCKIKLCLLIYTYEFHINSVNI